MGLGVLIKNQVVEICSGVIRFPHMHTPSKKHYLTVYEKSVKIMTYRIDKKQGRAMIKS